MTNKPAEMTSIPRQWRKIAKQALKEGWTINITGNKHLVWRGPQGQQIYVGSTPAANGASARNTIALMKRHGIDTAA